MATQVADDMAGSDQPKAAVLLIVGEPFSDSGKQQILDEIAKGLKRWDSDATGVDIGPELIQMAVKADLGEERRNGERVIIHQSDTLKLEVVLNGQAQTVKDSLRNLLSTPCPSRAVIYAGYTFHGSASWVLHDDLFSYNMFCQAFKDSAVETALKQTPGSSLMLSTVGGADWNSALRGSSDLNKLLKISVNPPAPATTDACQAVAQFNTYLGNLVRVTPLGSLMQTSDVIGNISFSRPVLYIFPGQQGDAALFGMKGFNMLIDGGYGRRPCFWDFVRHLDGIDALLVTHLGPDNLFGLKALMERKVVESVHPDVDYMYMNVFRASPTNGAHPALSGKEGSDSDLVINLSAEGSRLVDMSRKLGHVPHPLTRPLSSSLEPVNLFHKIGKGSLDMYVLNPVGDAKEMKEFMAQWGKQAPSFGQSNGIPIPNCSSICALLVVRPASSMEKVTRILFPGTAPQYKLIEGLERVKHLECLKHPAFCAHDLHKAKKAAMVNGRGSSVTRRTASSVTRAAATRAEPPRHLDTKTPTARTTITSPPSSKTAKSKKDTSNKRVSSSSAIKDKEKVKQDEKEKENKTKSTVTSSSSKRSVKTTSPVKSPKSPSPAKSLPDEKPKKITKPAKEDKRAEIPKDNVVDPMTTSTTAPLVEAAPPAKLVTTPTEDNRQASSSDAVPDPDHFGSDVDSGHRQQPPTTLTDPLRKLNALGIYENDDDDEGVDNRFDEKEGGGLFGGTGEEEVRPQALPEPVAVLDTPCSEPDLMPDAFCKPSLMEQSAFFENGIEPDYGTEGEVSVTDAQKDDMIQEQMVGEPLDVGSLVDGQPSAGVASSADQGKMLDSYPAEEHFEEQQAEESSLLSQSVMKQTEESSPMTQQTYEEFHPVAEPDTNKTAYDDGPQNDPTSLISECAVVEAGDGGFAPQPSIPTESNLLNQEPVEERPADAFNCAHRMNESDQEDEQIPKESEYVEEPKAETYPNDFQEHPPALADDFRPKDSSYSPEEKEDICSEPSDEEDEPAPSTQSHDDFKAPLAQDLQTSSAEPALECPPQNADYDHRELQEDNDAFGKDDNPALQKPYSGEDYVKESQLAPEEPSFGDDVEESPSNLMEPSFENDLKAANDMAESSSFPDSLKEASLPPQQEEDHLSAAPAALESSTESLRDTSIPVEEPDFGMQEKEPSPVLEDTDFEMEKPEAQALIEEPNIYDLKDHQQSSDIDERGFELQEKEASPSQGFDMEEREEIPTLEKDGFYIKEDDMNASFEEQRSDMQAKEVSPPMEEEIGDKMNEREVSPASGNQDLDEYEKEESPQLEDPEFEKVEVSPAMEDKRTEDLAEAGFDSLKERDASPDMEDKRTEDLAEAGFDSLKERDPSPDTEDKRTEDLAEAAFDSLKERDASPDLEEEDYEKEKESSPEMGDLSMEREEPSQPKYGDKYDEGEIREFTPPAAANFGAGDQIQSKEEEDFMGNSEEPQVNARFSEQACLHDKDNELEIKNAEEEKEEDEMERLVMNEEVMELKRDTEAENQDDELDGEDRAQADPMARQSMEGDISDNDQDDDDDEETAEAMDSGDNDDDFIYEKEVNLSEEGALMMGAASKAAPGPEETFEKEQASYPNTKDTDLDIREENQMDNTKMEDQQQPFVNPPANEEQMDYPVQKEEQKQTFVNPPVKEEQMDDLVAREEQQQTFMNAPGKEEFNEKYGSSVEGERRLDEGYGMEGGMMEAEERDMQEMASLQQGKHQAFLAQEEDSDLDSQDGDPRLERDASPLGVPQEGDPRLHQGSGHIGAAHQQQTDFPADSYPQGRHYDGDDFDDERAAPKEFDPVAQWGPPTGLPAPTANLVDEDAGMELSKGDFQSDGFDGQIRHNTALRGNDDGQGQYDEDQEEVIGAQGYPIVESYAGSVKANKHADLAGPDDSSEVDDAEFDPLTKWGQPMGLPAPTPPEPSKKNGGAAKKGAKDAKKTETKKATTTTTTTMKEKPSSAKRPASVATKPSPRTMNGTSDSPRSKPEAKKQDNTTPRTPRSNSARTPSDSKPRTSPTTATTPRRNASKARVSPEPIKMPPLPPLTPFYMDLTYIPNHGDTSYLDTEFFKRVRARYYVLSARNPNPKVLEMLMEGKAFWDKSNEQEVTVIPTYETPILQHWMAVHQEKLAESKIDVAPAASRCTVRLQDHEDSCYTYRLEF